ncbi:MAG: phage terminase large subunit [Nitrososphaerota archaeon]|nr:phage terminase large subunit [Nitrososphaerota archaeon]
METYDSEFTKEELDFLRSIKSSPAKFCFGVLGLKPFRYQKEFLEDRSKKIIACAGRQVGKSLICAAKALWFAITNPGTTTLIVSSTQRQSSLMFDKILRYVESSYLLEQSIRRKTRTMIRFSNDSEMVALPCGRHGASLRGHTAHLIIVDEAAFVPEDVITQVVTPMLSTTDGTIIMISTPYDKKHYFYRAFNSPRWSRYRFKTEDNPLVKKEFLEEQREEVGEVQFRQEYEAEFADDEKTYFPMALLRSSVHVCDDVSPCKYCSGVYDSSEICGDLYAGYDPGGMNDPAALVVVEKVSVEKKTSFRVVLTKTFVVKSKSGGPSDIYTRFTVEVADLHKRLKFRKLMVDSTGIGSPILEHCRELKLPVEGISFTRVRQEEMLSNLKIILEQGKITLPDNMDLLSSLNCIVAKRNRIGGHIFDHANGTHDDLAYALALALWGARFAPIIVMNSR